MTPPGPPGRGGGGDRLDPGRGGGRGGWIGPAAAVVLLVSGGLSLVLQGPPSPAGAAAPGDAFSAHRAMDHVRRLASRPRPPGTGAHDDARAYLRERLRALGLEPQTQERRLMFDRGRMVGSVTVRNVVARVPGHDPTGTFALATHYDSRWRTPGAGDAAAGVAAVLETLRALEDDLPLRNDLVVLFTDAEELGLLGARAFVDGHPWAEDLSVVANFEARGSAGPSLMFETGGATGRMLDLLRGGGSRPVTSSLFDVVYRRLPRGTDFTVFRNAGISGLNFAFIRGAEAYHTPLDTPGRLSRASLQHHGEHALSLTRTAGAADLSAGGDSSPIFFSLPVVGLVRYPGWAALPMAAGLGLGLLAMLGAGLVSGRIRGRGLAAGLVAAPVAVAMAAGVAWLLREAALAGHPESGWLVAQELYHPLPLLGASVAAAAGLLLAVFGVLRRWCGVDALVAGAVTWPAFLAVGVALNLPAASYLLGWPAAAGLAMAAWRLRAGGGERAAGRIGAPGAVVLLLLALPVAALAAPAIREFLAALTVSALPPIAAGAGVFLLCLAPLAPLLGRPNGWWAPATAAATAAALALPALLPGGSADGPRNAPLVREIDADLGRAWWATARDTGSAWLDGVVPEPFGVAPVRTLPASLFDASGTRRYRAAPTSPSSVPAARLSVLSDSTDGDGQRLLRVRLRLPEAARLPGAPLAVDVSAGEGPETRLLRVDGRAVPGDPGPEWVYRQFGAARGATELTVRVPAGGPVALEALLYLEGWPPGADGAPPPRPDSLMGSPRVAGRPALTDVTLVRSRLRP